jgi:hypothetical protein
MEIPNVIAFGAFLVGFLISLGLWTYLLKIKLPQFGKDIDKAIDTKAGVYIKQFKKDIKKEIPDFKTEITAILKTEVPKLVDTLLTDITDRMADPKDEKMNMLAFTAAYKGMAAARECMKDPEFKQDIDSFMDGKMSKVGSYLEKKLPGLLIGAAPEIKKALLGGGGGKEGEGGVMGILEGFIPPELRGMFGGR